MQRVREMHIKINLEWRLTADDHNYILQKRFPGKNGNPYWKNRYFYPTLDMALRDCRAVLLKDTSCPTLEELLEALEASSKKLEGIGKKCRTFWGRKD